VSLGLGWKWPGGTSDGLPALWELLHEMGHGIHLLLSCCCPSASSLPSEVIKPPNSRSTPQDRRYKHFSGLHLPLDLLEVPSMLMEKLAMDPIFLQVSDNIHENGRGEMFIDSTPPLL
jgi:hypothetical protein